jgi:hypothetical protein
MPKRITQDEAVARFRACHGERYGYDSVRYMSSATKVEVTCPKHGVFQITPQHHWSGVGCGRCAVEQGKTGKNEFELRSREYFGERYDYSLFDELPSYGLKVPIRCREHDMVFEQEARNHVRGHVGCPKCKSLKLSGPRDERGSVRTQRALTTRFIERARSVHGDRYDYSRFTYQSSSVKGVIVCTLHGAFPQSPSNHLNGSGCPRCGLTDAWKDSFKARCKALGVDYQRALKRREAGLSEEKIFAAGYVRSERKTTCVTVAGIEYPNMQAAVRALNPVASAQTIARRIAAGMSPEEAFRKIPNPGYANGIIYRVTHIESGKSYVGLTIQTLERRWCNHNEQARSGGVRDAISLHQAIRDFGVEAFTIEQIDSGTSKLTLEAKERRWIEKLGTAAPAGFNIAGGGVSGGSNCKLTVVDNKKFRSAGEAAMYVAASRGITLAAAEYRIRKGRLDVRKPAAKGQSLVKTAAYKTWDRIKNCALNQRSQEYIPGLDLCEQWRTFEGFLATVGQPSEPGMAFVRLDKRHGFFPENCRWLPKSEASKLNAAWMKSMGTLTGRKKRQTPDKA